MKYLILLLLLAACAPTKESHSMTFAKVYKIYPSTTGITKGRVYLIHGLYGNMNYYKTGIGNDIVTQLQAASYDVVGLDYPYSDSSFWSDGGLQYRNNYKNYLTWVTSDIDTKYGTASSNIIGGISFGGLHAMVGFSDFHNYFDNWFGIVPVTHLNALSDFSASSAPYFDAFNEKAILAQKDNMLLWGTQDFRVNFNLTIDLKDELLALGSNTNAVEVTNLPHTVTQNEITELLNWINSL